MYASLEGPLHSVGSDRPSSSPRNSAMVHHMHQGELGGGMHTLSPPPAPMLAVKTSSSPSGGSFVSSSNLYNLDTATTSSSPLQGGYLGSQSHYPDYGSLHQPHNPHTHPLDLHDSCNNNNNSSTNNNYTCPTFTPSPSSDSHCESPTTPTNSTSQPLGMSQYGAMTMMDLSGPKERGRNDDHLTPPNSANLLSKDQLVSGHVGTSSAVAAAALLSAPLALRGHMKVEGDHSPLENDQKFQYSSDQVDCICDSLQQRGEFKTLENFLHIYSNSNDSISDSNVSESVLRGRAAVAFDNGNYRELYAIIESRDFNPSYHLQLQDMWYKAHYKEAESVRGRPLGKAS